MLTSLDIYALIIAAFLSLFPWEKWLHFRETRSISQQITSALLLTFSLTYTLYLIYIGGDAFGPRMALIVVALFSILLDNFISRVAAILKQTQWNWNTILSVLLVISTFSAWSIPSSFAFYPNPDAVQHNWVQLGRWLRKHSPKKAILAVDAAGAIPYFSELHTIDMLGLNDLHIAHIAVPNMGEGRPGHEKYDPEYIYRNHPDWIAAWIDRTSNFYYGLNRWPEVEGYSLYMVVQMQDLSKPWNRMIRHDSDITKLWDEGYTYGLWKRNNQVIPSYTEIEMSSVRTTGKWELRARAINGIDYFFTDIPGSSLLFDVSGGSVLALTMLCHSWSGIINIKIGGTTWVVDLFSANLNPQCVRQFIVPGSGRVPVIITVEAQKNPSSQSTQVFINRILILETPFYPK